MDGLPQGPGYRAVTRHADVEAISRQPALFCSGPGCGLDRGHAGRAQRVLRLDDQHGRPPARQDPPDRVEGVHPADARAARRLGARIADEVAAEARRNAEAGDGTIDVVTDIAAPIPLRVICDMMGVPDEDRALVLSESNIILSGGDPELIEDEGDALTAVPRGRGRRCRT